MYYIIYKTTNVINGKIYIGQHVTSKLNDGYLGSGHYLWRAINKHGKENFIREILYEFDNEIDMNNKEIELVNEEFVKRSDTYNVALGGQGLFGRKRATVKDKDGNTLSVFIDDPRYLSGELVGLGRDIPMTEKQKKKIGKSLRGKVNVKDKDGNKLKVSVDDPRIKTGELVGINVGCPSPIKGRVWIHKDSKTKCIQKHELNEWLSNGWKRGRC